MKKAVTILAILMVVISCKKEEVNNPECKCGVVVSTQTNSVGYPSMEVKNNCSNKVMTESNYDGLDTGDEVCYSYEW